MILDRKKILEVLAFWKTRISAEMLGDILGVSRQTAQDTVIGEFRRKFPGYLDFQRRWQGLPNGVTLQDSVLGEQDLGRVYNLLAALTDFGEENPKVSPIGRNTILGFPAEEVKMQTPGNGDLLRKITAAAGHGRAVMGLYSFKSTGETRVKFSPHSMIKTPYRFHFRGMLESWSDDKVWFCHGYRDLVPARFIYIEEDTVEGVSGLGDIEWLEEETFTFRINPDLPAEARLTFAWEHGVDLKENGYYEITFTDRRCYGHYYRNEIYARRWKETNLPVWVEV
jgi:hypothetical protein